LADPGDQSFALLPRHAGCRQFPVSGRHQPAAFARNVEAKRLSVTQPPSHRGDAIDAGALRCFVEEDVAGPFDRIVQMHGPVPVF